MSRATYLYLYIHQTNRSPTRPITVTLITDYPTNQGSSNDLTPTYPIILSIPTSVYAAVE